jgi:hypothetical protein
LCTTAATFFRHDAKAANTSVACTKFQSQLSVTWQLKIKLKLAGRWKVTEMYNFRWYEVLIAALMKSQVLWDFTLYQLVKLPMLV